MDDREVFAGDSEARTSEAMLGGGLGMHWGDGGDGTGSVLERPTTGISGGVGRVTSRTAGALSSVRCFLVCKCSVSLDMITVGSSRRPLLHSDSQAARSLSQTKTNTRMKNIRRMICST